MTVWTVGHSTRPLAELTAILQEAGITDLVDVRRFPGSRRHPQFARASLEQSLPAAGLRYHHEVDLGGMRTARPDSPHTAWKDDAFRGYADHMGSPEFRAALERVRALAATGRPAVMCAEADPSRCHRRLLADALVARGEGVVHLLAPGRSQEHALHPDAVVGEDGAIVYRASRGPLFRGV
jgi:uncharacterized protein (DUF488 family)